MGFESMCSGINDFKDLGVVTEIQRLGVSKNLGGAEVWGLDLELLAETQNLEPSAGFGL